MDEVQTRGQDPLDINNVIHIIFELNELKHDSIETKECMPSTVSQIHFEELLVQLEKQIQLNEQLKKELEELRDSKNCGVCFGKLTGGNNF